MKNKYLRNIKSLKKKIDISSKYENKSIKEVLKWLKNNNKKDKMVVKKVSINSLKDWKIDKKGTIYHKSKQFFTIEGVKIKNGFEREVSRWDQPILSQRHGGVLAILFRETESKVIEFLLCARREPGDKTLKLCPSFSATQSNMNLAHGGKKTDLYDLIIGKKIKIFAQTMHNEEGARFWQKKNLNVLIRMKTEDLSKINTKKFIWLNLNQIRKLNLSGGIINPFVKTILFMVA